MKSIFFLAFFLGLNTLLHSQCWKSVRLSTIFEYSTGLKMEGTLWRLCCGTVGASHQIGNDSDWEQLAGEFALKNNGSLWFLDPWSQDALQIGNENNWMFVTGSLGHYHALKIDGSLWAWEKPEFNQFPGAPIPIPTQIGHDNDWAQVAAGGLHTVAIKTDGSLWAWGNNEFGQLGDGTNSNKDVPTKVGFDNDWEYVSAGYLHTLAIKTDGSLWTWGNSGIAISNTPIQMGLDNDWKLVAAGGWHDLAIKTDGSLWAWGESPANGTHSTQPIPFPLDSLNEWDYIYANTGCSAGIRNDKTLWVWGLCHQGVSPKWDYSTMVNIVCGVTTSHDIQEINPPLFVFPNPAKNEITVQFAEKTLRENKVCILNLQGKVLFEQIVDNLSMSINIEEIPKGIYLITLHGNKDVAYAKFIKE